MFGSRCRTELVREDVCKAQQRQKRNYDRGKRERRIEVGDEVLLETTYSGWDPLR